MAKQYISPEMEIVEVDANDGNKYSLPYGIAKGLGLDTTGMRPREVWEMLKGRGITPENEYEKLKEKAQQEIPEEKPEVVDSLYNEKQKEKVQRFRNEHQKKTHEFALVLNENGDTIIYREGKTGSVSFYVHELKTFGGGSLTHNHPQGNTCLSDADIDIFAQYNIRTMEAVGYDGWIHTIELLPKDNPEMMYGMQKRVVEFANAYKVALSNANKKARNKFYSIPNRQKIKSGRYIIDAPEGWHLYRKGASPRDAMNYVEYAHIVQEEMKSFSKDTEQKYGVKSTFRKGD